MSPDSPTSAPRNPDSPSSEATPYDLIVVGGGIAGSAAALRAGQYGLRTLWLRGSKLDAKRSRGQWVYNIDNMIGVHDGIVRAKVRKLLRGDDFAPARAALDQAPHMPISTRDIIDNAAERIEREYAEWVTPLFESAREARWVSAAASPGLVPGATGVFQVSSESSSWSATQLILATGVMDRQPQILKSRRGEVQDDIKWIYPAANREQVLYCIRCEGHLTRGERVAVIGHGEGAAQIAMMLHERYGSASLVLRNGEASEWSEDSAALLDHYGIDVRGERIVEIDSSREGMQAIELEGGDRFELSFALVALGLYRVYNELAQQLGAELADPERPPEERHVRIDHRGETTVPGLFAIGDMAWRPDEPVMKQIYTSQEYAVRAVDSVDSRRRRQERTAALQQARATPK